MAGRRRHLLIIVLYGVFTVTVCLEHYFHKDSPPIYYFDYNIIETVQTQTLTECCMRCSRTPTCQSLAFKISDDDPNRCFTTSTEKDYTGTWNYTYNGVACQRWDSQSPHRHTTVKPRWYFPDATTEAAANYCRAPDSSKGAWCYSISPGLRWVQCNIYRCIEYNCRLFDLNSFSITRVGEQPGIEFYNKVI